jgi:hypothetical protein
MSTFFLALWARYGLALHFVGMAIVPPLLFPRLEPAAAASNYWGVRRSCEIN